MGEQGPKFDSLNGTLSYEDRVTLGPEVYAVVNLQDMTAAGQVNILAEQRIDRPNKNPILFTLLYDAKAIKSGHRYAVTANIYAGQRLLFDTALPFWVLTPGNPDTADLVLHRVKPTEDSMRDSESELLRNPLD